MASGEESQASNNIWAFIVAWLWPGGGHLVLGEKTRGLLVMGGILVLFLGGVFIGGLDVVDRRNDRLWFIAQAGAGPIAFVTDFARGRLLDDGRVGTMLPTPATRLAPGGPVRQKTMVNSHKSIGHINEIGTLFCALAGLMNIVVMLDAFAGPDRADDGPARRSTDA